MTRKDALAVIGGAVAFVVLPGWTNRGKPPCKKRCPTADVFVKTGIGIA